MNVFIDETVIIYEKNEWDIHLHDLIKNLLERT